MIRRPTTTPGWQNPELDYADEPEKACEGAEWCCT